MRLHAGVAIVRPWRDTDADALAAEANDRRIASNLRDAFPCPYELEDAKGFLAMATAMSPQTYFAIEVDGRAAGGIGYTLQGDVSRVGAEVGYWLGVAHWGRGIMTAAVRSLSDHAFASHPELRRLFAVPFATNAASARVLEKAGYTREGTLRDSVIKGGSVLDSWMYARLRPGSEPRAQRWYTRPVFFVGDVQRAIRFYVDGLGFVKKWHEADGSGTVCQVDHGECEIILCQDAERHDRSRLFVELTRGDLAAFRRELAERSIPNRTARWGYDVVVVTDPDGNELFFPIEG